MRYLNTRTQDWTRVNGHRPRRSRVVRWQAAPAECSNAMTRDRVYGEGLIDPNAPEQNSIRSIDRPGKTRIAGRKVLRMDPVPPRRFKGREF
jgi:hypothetical protein